MVHFRFPIRQLPAALQDFATDMETIVDQVFNQGECKGNQYEAAECESAFRPAIDITESESRFDVFMDLPGVKSDAVKIEMLEEKLVVSGERVVAPVGEGVSSHRLERSRGLFSRSIQLPKQLDVDKIEAQFDNGVLHVVLPKMAKPAARTIEIKAN